MPAQALHEDSLQSRQRNLTPNKMPTGPKVGQMLACGCSAIDAHPNSDAMILWCHIKISPWKVNHQALTGKILVAQNSSSHLRCASKGPKSAAVRCWNSSHSQEGLAFAFPSQQETTAPNGSHSLFNLKSKSEAHPTVNTYSPCVCSNPFAHCHQTQAPGKQVLSLFCH